MLKQIHLLIVKISTRRFMNKRQLYAYTVWITHMVSLINIVAKYSNQNYTVVVEKEGKDFITD